MIIRIFGDSFADPMTKHLAWTEILCKNYGHTVENFAVACSSLFYSYQQLIKNIIGCDLVIFVATHSGRLYYPDSVQIRGICNLNSVKNYIKNTHVMSSQEQKIFNAAEQYYLYLSDDDFNQFVHKQIISEIYKLCNEHNKTLILIPAFFENIKLQQNCIFKTSLFEITQKELYTTFNSIEYKYQEKPTRPCHMSLKNNSILAMLINDIILNTREFITIDNFVFEKESNPELFWKLD
jgi:hypothetical protein